MIYTVVYTTDDPLYLMVSPFDVPSTVPKHMIEGFVEGKFDYIFRKCFGDTLDYTIVEIKEGKVIAQHGSLLP